MNNPVSNTRIISEKGRSPVEPAIVDSNLWITNPSVAQGTFEPDKGTKTLLLFSIKRF